MSEIKHTTLLYFIIAILTATLFIQRCNVKSEQIKIVVPEYKGSFRDSAPVPIDIPDEEYRKILKDTVLAYSHYVDPKVIEDFETSKPSVQIAKYIDAKGERKYENTFEDDRIKINYKATTLGTLEDLNLDYTIKEFTVTQDAPKSTVFALYGGTSITTNTHLDKNTVNLNLGIQNKRGDLMYATYGLDKSIQVGYMFRLINIKK